MLSFLDSLPHEYPEDFPEFWKNRVSIQQARKDLDDAELSHLAVSLEGFEGTGRSDNENPYDRSETLRSSDEAE